MLFPPNRIYFSYFPDPNTIISCNDVDQGLISQKTSRIPFLGKWLNFRYKRKTVPSSLNEKIISPFYLCSFHFNLLVIDKD